MKKIPISIPAKRFSNLGRRIWLMAQGKDLEPIQTMVKPPKTIGHGKVMPPQTKELATILTYFQHMAEKVGARLRKHQFKAHHFYIGLKTVQTKIKLKLATDDGLTIFSQCRQFIMAQWQVQITTLDPHTEQQSDLFEDNEINSKRNQINKTVDLINQRYGEFTIDQRHC